MFQKCQKVYFSLGIAPQIRHFGPFWVLMPENYGQAGVMGKIRKRIFRGSGLIILPLALALGLTAQAVAEPRPLTPVGTSSNASNPGLIGPLVTFGEGQYTKIVSLKTGIPAGARGPLRATSDSMQPMGSEILILQGTPGARGSVGPTGASGLDGRNGLIGLSGLDGSNGQNGIDGLDGLNGEDVSSEDVTRMISSEVNKMIPTDDEACPAGFATSIGNSWNERGTVLSPSVECKSLLADTTADLPSISTMALKAASVQSFSTEPLTPEYSSETGCSVGSMFGRLITNENSQILVECVPSQYVSLGGPTTIDVDRDSLDPESPVVSCGAQSFVGGLGFNSQNEIVIGCVDASELQTQIEFGDIECPGFQVMVGLTWETNEITGAKVISVSCASLPSLQNPSDDNSNNGNNNDSELDGNNGQNQCNNGNNNDSSDSGNNGSNQGNSGNNADSSDPTNLDVSSDLDRSELTGGVEDCDEGDSSDLGATSQVLRGEAGAKGDAGSDGLSAFDIWKAQSSDRTNSSESDFLESLRGPSAAASKGDAGPKGDTGSAGLSAFEIWKAQEANRKNSSEAEFLESLKGTPGEATTGSAGLSAFEIWKAQEPNRRNSSEADFLTSLQGSIGATGATGAKGDTGAAGLSAFEIWKAQEANRKNSSEADFLTSLRGSVGATGAAGATGTKGDTGAAGLSAFEIWKAQDNSRRNSTEADFLASLKGEASTAIPLGWQEQKACRATTGEMKFGACSAQDKKAGWLEFTFLLKTSP